MNILQLTNLSFAWVGQEYLWRDVNLSVAPGEHVGLMGRNGSGKTTLFRCITGLLPITSGEILLEGKPISTEKDFQRLRQHVGFCLQAAGEQLIFPEVEDDVCFGPLNMGFSPGEARERAQETLQMLGIGHLARRHCFHLSGGEQRLVALAGILAQKPALLLLDEPFTGLDPLATDRIMTILADLPCAKIIAAHHKDFLEALGCRIYTMTPTGLRE